MATAVIEYAGLAQCSRSRSTELRRVASDCAAEFAAIEARNGGAMVSGRHHSKAVKLAATVLARLAGEQAASDTFGIDRRTIRGWVKHEDVPTDSWAALDELAGAQLLEKVAGARSPMRRLSPPCAVSRRGTDATPTLIAKREARREEAEQPEPITASQQQIDRLDDSRKMLLACELDYELEDRAYKPFEPDEPGVKPRLDGPSAIAWLTAHIDRMLALTDDEVEEQRAAWSVIFDERDQEQYRDWNRGDPESRVEPEPEPAEVPEPAPTPIRSAVAAPRPVPMVMDMGRSEPWYDLDTGERRRSYR